MLKVGLWTVHLARLCTIEVREDQEGEELCLETITAFLVSGREGEKGLSWREILEVQSTVPGNRWAGGHREESVSLCVVYEDE